MAELEQFNDVPFHVRVVETNTFVREIAYNDQVKRSSRWSIDFNKLVNHALHNHYCISFIKCPFPLNFDSLVNHFDWCSRYLYFNFEESMLRIEIFTKLENRHYDQSKLGYLTKLLKKYPQAYQYDLDDTDHRQKWALLKKANFQKNTDFLKMVENDKQQRGMLLDYLQTLQEKIKNGDIVDSGKEVSRSTVVSGAGKREREASNYNFLKLNDELTPAIHNEIIEFLYSTFQPCFRIPYPFDIFRTMFYDENSPTLKLVKKDSFDNQSLKIIFQALKEAKGLVVSWQIIERKVQVFKANGTPFSGFSELSMNKINPKKRRQQEKAMESIIELISNRLVANKRK